MGAESVIGAVEQQYAAYPYPARDPQDERKRLICTWLDDLRLVNHYGFRGERDFAGTTRILVAGGGTGDASLYYAEQLRDTPAEIVHLDLSASSIAIARERAAIRGLGSIRFVQGSLLDLPALGLGVFDIVNCVGVLHHLPEPEAGLEQLLKVLAPDGVMVLMVYAQYGRTGVYQMQELLRRLSPAAASDHERVVHARAVLDALPATNWFKRGEKLHGDHHAGGDAGLYDLLLHSQDRAYTVAQLYEWLADRCGLNLHFSDWHRGAWAYELDGLVARANPELRASAAALPLRERQAAAELMRGDIITHSFYATRGADTVAAYGDAGYVPVFVNDAVFGIDFVNLIESHRNRPFELPHRQSGLRVTLDPGRHVKAVFRHLDERRSFAEIFDRVRAGLAAGESPPSDEQLFAEFEPWFRALNGIERMVLRRPGAYRGLLELRA